MSRIRVSKKALADIRGIWVRVAEDRPASADALIDSFYKRFHLAHITAKAYPLRFFRHRPA